MLEMQCTQRSCMSHREQRPLHSFTLTWMQRTKEGVVVPYIIWSLIVCAAVMAEKVAHHQLADSTGCRVVANF